jgi:Rad3-related DNA helicase
MERAAQQIEDGEPAEGSQDDALDRLDDAQQQLQKSEEQAEERLQRERLAKLAEALKGLKERQETLGTEGERVFNEVAGKKRWERALRASAKQLAGAERDLAGETKALAEKRFKDLKVFGRMAQDAADAMSEAADEAARVVDQGDDGADSLDADRRSVRSPQERALRRFNQILEALKDDPADRSPPRKQQPAPGGDSGSEGSGGQGDGVPPLAQLKLLRAMQTEVNERTETFAKGHPDLTKLAEPDQAELEAIRTAQAAVGELLDELNAPPPDPGVGPAIPPEPKGKEKP